MVSADALNGEPYSTITSPIERSESFISRLTLQYSTFNTQFTHIDDIRLKRIYLLINASHGLKESDLTMLSHLNTQCTQALANGRHITLQAIFTKCDLLLRSTSGKEGQKTLQKMQDEVFEAAPLCLPGIVTAASGGGGALVGVEKVRKSVVEACGLGRVSTPVVRRASS